jgi:xylulokinase
MKCFLGIDAGTSGIKAIVLDETGKVCAAGYHECDIITPRPGWVEQNPHDWWTACQAAVKQVVKLSGYGSSIAAIGFSGQMQGSVVVDKDMEPIGNCMIWLDQRSSQEVADIENLIDGNEMLDITSNYCLNSFWAPKLLWLKKNRPDEFGRVHKVMFAKDYLRYKMTGEVATEVSDASLSFLMDVPKRKWAEPIFDKLGIPRSIVPERLAESAEIVGWLNKGVAEELGLNAGIPVVAGGGDQPAGGVGTGVVCDGRIGATIGTSGVVFGCCSEPFIDHQKRAMLSMAHSVPDKWCYLGLVLTAGASFKWLRDTVFADKKAQMAAEGKDIYDYMSSLAETAQPGSEGLTFLPYLNGEKTPWSDENARGVFFGLSYRHGLGNICRSVMEGVTFALRDTIEICRNMGIDVKEVRANGGGAKSALWRQLQADIYNTNVVTMNLEEGPAAGAAIMAAVGAGHFSSVGEGCDALLKVTSITEPGTKNAEIYNEYYQTYRELYPALKGLYKKQAVKVSKGL